MPWAPSQLREAVDGGRPLTPGERSAVSESRKRRDTSPTRAHVSVAQSCGAHGRGRERPCGDHRPLSLWVPRPLPSPLLLTGRPAVGLRPRLSSSLRDTVLKEPPACVTPVSPAALQFWAGQGSGGILDNCSQSMRGWYKPGVTLRYSVGTLEMVTIVLHLLSLSLRWALLKQQQQGICSWSEGFEGIRDEGIKVLLKYLYIETTSEATRSLRPFSLPF